MSEEPYTYEEIKQWNERLQAELESAKRAWIPCAERLPFFAIRVVFWHSRYEERVGAMLNAGPYKPVWVSGGDSFEPEDVVAWLPLPPPYRPEVKPLVHVKHCELGNNWKDCPACIANHFNAGAQADKLEAELEEEE